MKLYNIVMALRNAKGSKEKQAILDANKHDELFKAFMQATYDPAISYYMTKAPKVSAADMAELDLDFIDWMAACIAGRVVTGGDAVKVLKMNMAAMDSKSQELVQLMLDRKIGASVGDTMVLKTWPDLYFLPPYMRCSSMDKKVKAYYQTLSYFFVQEKRDGSFAYMKPKQIATRQGSVYPEWFVKHMSRGLPENIVLVGELEVEMYDGDNYLPMARKEGNGVLNSVLQGADESEFANYRFIYTAWDCLDESEFIVGKSVVPQETRFEGLKDIVKETNRGDLSVVYNARVTSVAEANKIHLKFTKLGKEGTVWKTPDGEWRNSSGGTKDAVKNKVVFSCEMEVEDYYEGKGKAAGMLGGVRMKSSCGRVKNDCGSGFSDDQRKHYWSIKEQLPGKIFEVEGNDITEAEGKSTFSISLPIFIEERFDKKQADSYERIVEQFEAVKNGLDNENDSE